MHKGIKLRHVRAFLDIADDGSLSAVARRHGITQPALSRTLAELEALLGQRLFLRQGRRLTLTEAGRLFRRHAAIGLRALEAGAAALSPSHEGGTLRVGVLPTAAARLFPLVALRFAELQPQTILSVETGSNTYLLRMLRDHTIDLMVGRMPPAEDMGDLTFDHLYEDDIVPCIRQGHPLAGRPVADLLRAAPLVLPPRGAIIRRAVDDYLASLGLVGLRPAFETVSLAVGRGLVAGSDAVWFISRGVIAEELSNGRLVAVSTGARFLSGAVGLTRRQGATQRAGLDLIFELMHEIARERA